MKLLRWFGIAAVSLPLFSATFHVSSVQEFRQALEDAANNGEEIDTIILGKGIYKTTTDGLGTFVFDSKEESNLTIIGSGREQTILDGDESTQILNVQGYSGIHFSLTLKKLSLLHGKPSLQNIEEKFKRGAGIYVNGTLFVDDCNISYNISSSIGGGIYTYYDVNINNSTLTHNFAQYGGGVYSSHNISLTNSIISNNKAKHDGGGLKTPYIAYVRHSVISHNEASRDGAGIKAGRVKIEDSKLIYNSVEYGSGGGIKCSAGESSIKNSDISYNEAKGSGGGIQISSGDVEVINSKFTHNTSYEGTGGAIAVSYGNILSLNSLYFENRSNEGKRNAGSLAVYSGGGYEFYRMVLINNNFIDNFPKQVYGHGKFINNIFLNDGIMFDDKAYIYNNYIENNRINPSFENKRDLGELKNNLEPSIVGDIKLANDNLTLLPGSPAIDEGLNPDDKKFKNIFDSIYYKIVKYLKTDYFGHPRIVNGHIDIGATEYRASMADNKLIIHIQISGDQKVYSPVTIHLTIESSKPIAALYIDKGEGYEPVDVNQRTFTLTFQKPGEHTIKFKVVDEDGNEAEVNKTLHIYAMSVQEAIEYGKKLCKQDPVSCGIQVETQASKDMIFITPKEHLVQILAQQSVFPISGYFIHYNDPQSPNPKFDWIYVTLHKSVYKLQGMKSDGSFSWSENLKNEFSSIVISSDGKSVIFTK